MKERVIWYEKHGIHKERYLELKHFALQYPKYIAEFAKMCRENRYTNRVEELYRRIQAIEGAASVAADGKLRECLILNVTTGRTERQLNPPCGHAQFYALRRAFFLELDKRTF